MADAIAHRGPDADGYFIDWDKRVALGHRRLAVIDTENGSQPMTHSHTGITLAFNGEIYNFRELRSQLLSLGHVFHTESDTEVLLVSYVQWGEASFEKLIGMFAFVIWDPRRNKLVCVRDRVGIKPFYYYWDGENFIFASEVKSLYLHPAFKKEINHEGVFDYCHYGYTLGKNTAFENTHKLSPGSTITVDLCEGRRPTLSHGVYWSIEKAKALRNNNVLSELSRNDVHLSLEPLLKDAVSSHMVSDVDLGVLLSGGVDSTLVVDLMAQFSNDISAHNVSFGQSSLDESAHARHVSELLDIEYTHDDIPTHMAEDVEKIICHFDEPFADASAIAMYYLSQSASTRYKVCLSGDGGDELFGGYNWYAELLKLQTADKLLPRWTRNVLSTFARSAFDPSKRGRMLLANLDQGFPARHENLVSVFQHDWLKSLLDVDALDLFTKDSVSTTGHYGRIADIHASSPFSDDPIIRAQYADVNSYLVDDVLVKVDRMSMAHGLEVRVPLLDHHVVESAFSLPTHLKINASERKIAIKELIKTKYGSMFTNRKKQGFSVPLRSWLKNDLFHLVDEYLLTGARTTPSGYFLSSEVRNLWNRFNYGKGHVDLSNNIWLLICFEVWHKNLRSSY
ncbi:asparagine synthase (glutamine-hydrolyzing) [Gammaproteobacteria bacterium 42_54_T18]|nr:asparagine synthase (glutamine-hydrolyzing) [Gammaproteobacteria bacterium 42_54_T18]